MRPEKERNADCGVGRECLQDCECEFVQHPDQSHSWPAAGDQEGIKAGNERGSQGVAGTHSELAPTPKTELIFDNNRSRVRTPKESLVFSQRDWGGLLEGQIARPARMHEDGMVVTEAGMAVTGKRSQAGPTIAEVSDEDEQEAGLDEMADPIGSFNKGQYPVNATEEMKEKESWEKKKKEEAEGMNGREAAGMIEGEIANLEQGEERQENANYSAHESKKRGKFDSIEMRPIKAVTNAVKANTKEGNGRNNQFSFWQQFYFE